MNRKPPQLENAPGLTWRPRKYGFEARWRARTDLVARGYRPKNMRLWIATKNEPEPPAGALLYIHDMCNALQSEMLVWGRGGIPVNMAFDGTLASLAHCYQTDKDSPYQKVRYKTRQFYDVLCKRITGDYGDEPLSNIKARTLLRWHEEWSEGGKVAMAHALIGMFRTLIGFGATFLEDPECERLSAAMHRMRFKMAKPRVERLTADQADLIRALAVTKGWKSLALGQAFQFDLMLRQKDVIGEWVPITELGTSDVIGGNDKWLRGLRWNEIDGNMVLKHVTSKRQKEIEVNLRLAPMVMEELARMVGVAPANLERSMLPASGPVIVNDRTGKPWLDGVFRVVWRKLANECGIPKTVRNMDSRAGAISEATDAGAELEHVRHAATHGDIAMTQRYSRGSVDKVANVMAKRAEHRNKGGT